MGLLKPAWQGEDVEKAIKVIEKENNQNNLYKIATKAPLGGIRAKAVEKLNDQSMLADIAENDRDWEVRKLAVEKMANQIVLSNVAKRDEMSLVADAAVKRITEQTILFDIVCDGAAHISVRGIAISMITDQLLLTDIALGKNHVDWDASLHAADKLADRAVAHDVYNNISKSEYSAAREAAAIRLAELN